MDRKKSNVRESVEGQDAEWTKHHNSTSTRPRGFGTNQSLR